MTGSIRTPSSAFVAAPRAVLQGGTTSLKGLAILVVDDEEDVRELVEVVLARAGAVVILASTAAEALAVATAASFDVIVSDIGMPGKDGYALLDDLRALPHHGTAMPPAIALTAFTRPEDRTRAQAAGFALHLGKPCSPSALVAAVEEVAHAHGRPFDAR